MKSDLIDIDVHIHHETKLAWLISISGKEKDAVWIPKSAAEYEGNRHAGTLTLPERVAIDKGLV